MHAGDQNDPLGDRGKERFCSCSVRDVAAHGARVPVFCQLDDTLCSNSGGANPAASCINEQLALEGTRAESRLASPLSCS